MRAHIRKDEMIKFCKKWLVVKYRKARQKRYPGLEGFAYHT